METGKECRSCAGRNSTWNSVRGLYVASILYKLLNFAGTYNWFANLVAEDKWYREIAVRTNDTFGHPWTKITKLPDNDADDWALKDLIHVPSQLKEGHYILSSRWDAQSTSRVFNSCAKIELV